MARPDKTIHPRKYARPDWEEVDFMNSWKVWDVRPRAEAWEKTGKPPLGGRWVDYDKGDASNPNIRCRYVACEVKTYRGIASLHPRLPSRPLGWLCLGL